MFSTGMVKPEVWMLAVTLAIAAGWTDWRWRRIPNWLTVSGLGIAIAASTVAGGWPGAKDSLLGAALGFGLLLPFALVRSLGMGDLKLVTALGGFLGPGRLILVLFGAILVNGVMAVILVVHKKRVRQTLQNMGHMLAAFFSFHLPGPQLSLENPESLKVPFGVAVAVAVILYTARQAWGTS